MEVWQGDLPPGSEFPWIVFRLGNNQYAINSEQVSSISLLSGDVTPMPDALPHVRGVWSIRGTVIPLLDLHMLFAQVSLLEEYHAFFDMLEQRKQDHLHWAEELRRSIEQRSAFSLTTDPHKCAFGQWYDHYHDERSTVQFQLAKIDAPHKKLHHEAVLAQEALSICDPMEQERRLKQILTEVETQDIPAIVGLLDETAAVIKDNIREQVLVLGAEQPKVGCIVDEVLAVQALPLLSGKEIFHKVMRTKYVMGVSQNEQGLILLLEERLFENAIQEEEREGTS